MAIYIITNCTSRKRSAAPPVTLRPPKGKSIAACAESWVTQLAGAKTLVAATELYVGRSVVDAKSVAWVCGGELMVVSAGLGLIGGQSLVPNYQLTVANGGGSIRPWLIRNNYQPEHWWAALNSAIGNLAPVSSRINGSFSEDVFLIALPSTYIGLIAEDLARVQPGKAHRVRFFTSANGVSLLPKPLLQSAMPYDDRLEGVGGYAGTRSDFPQRAMRHFVEELQAHGSSVSAGSEAVCRIMAASRRKEIPRRTKLDDSEISKLIAANWVASGGSASRLLRVLRDDKLVACEQSRFSSLWRQVRDQISMEELHV